MVKFLIFFGYFLCLMDTYAWNTGEPHNRLMSALIFATCRVIWSLSTAALIWICISGNGDGINRFLSANVFIPLSRMTYSVYLTHVWFIWLFVGTRRERIDTNRFEIVYIFLHNLIISYSFGFVFTLLIELPVIKLQKCLTKRFIKAMEKSEGFDLNIKLNDSSVLKVEEFVIH